jgi:hypothetical protein
MVIRWLAELQPSVDPHQRRSCSTCGVGNARRMYCCTTRSCAELWRLIGPGWSALLGDFLQTVEHHLPVGSRMLGLLGTAVVVLG